MKKFVALALAAGVIGAAGSAMAQPSIGVSIGINQPGVYGRINIGNVPPPALVLPQPVVIAPSSYAAQRQPIYLYVPPGHQKNWGRYCGRYGACGQPVYFVKDQWVRERYEQEHHGDRYGRHDDRGRRDDRRDDHGDRGRDHRH